MLAPFEDAVFASVADDHGFDPDRLRDLVARHQRSVRESPGVDYIVYGWRKTHGYDPVLARTGEAYVCAVTGVWEEFGEQLGFSAEELAAVRAVHDRQARLLADPHPEADPVVLTRT